MTAPLQQQLTPGDHQYFEWSTSKQQTNLIHPLMAHTHHKHYYQHYEEKHSLQDNQLKQNKTLITSPLRLSPTSHIKKRQKTNGIESSLLNTNDEQNQSQQTCYPFQAELTQKIDIECNGNSPNQIAHTPTHHFTLSTVINVSVNGQTQKSLDILPSPSQQQYPLKSNAQQDLHVHPLVPYSELTSSLYLKDIDVTAFDTFILPSCPNPEDYLTVDGLLTFLMSDKTSSQQMSNYPRTQHYRYPYPQYQMSQYYNYPRQYLPAPCASSTTMGTGTPSYYRQSSLPQQMTRYYSTSTPTPSFR